ncbi:MAG: PDZ domain-containing protein [Proteobacteria bacterium]|nr:PDZ domain-containing protein [Pseudomonadota bacterium]
MTRPALGHGACGATRVAVMAALIAVVALGAWYWRMHGAAALAPPPTPAPQPPPAAAPGARTPPAAALPPASLPGTVADPSAAPATEAAAPGASDADRRQDEKIARGLAALPDGSGILVVDTPPASPAAELHLQRGDVLTAINGEKAMGPEDFVRIYRAQGLPTQLTVMREGRELHLH